MNPTMQPMEVRRARSWVVQMWRGSAPASHRAIVRLGSPRRTHIRTAMSSGIAIRPAMNAVGTAWSARLVGANSKFDGIAAVISAVQGTSFSDSLELSSQTRTARFRAQRRVLVRPSNGSYVAMTRNRSVAGEWAHTATVDRLARHLAAL